MTLLIAAITSGCTPPNAGWVTDTEHYYELSGFKVKPPSGSDWYVVPEEAQNRTKITFVKVEPTAIRFNPYHPEFTTTLARAILVPTPSPLAITGSAEENAKLLRLGLKRYGKRYGLKISDSSYTTSFDTPCIMYKAEPLHPDIESQYGVIRVDSVKGYICLHPLYNDVIVAMESINGASAELDPRDRDQNMEHFFRSLRFTHTDLPPAPPSSSSEKASR